MKKISPEFVTIISSQMEKIETRVNNNFYQQAFLIAIGLSLLLGKEAFLSPILEKLGFPEDSMGLMIFILIVLQLLFLRFGYLLYHFIAVRKTMVRIITPYLSEFEGEAEKKYAEESIRPLSYFEILNNETYKDKYKTTVFVFVSIIFSILALNHFICLNYILRLFIANSILKWSIIAFYVIYNSALYREFINYNKEQYFGKIFSGFSWVMLILIIAYILINIFGIDIWN